MNSDQMEGSAHEVVGGLREGAGKLTGYSQLKGEGAMERAPGALQHGYGQVKEGAQTLVDGMPAFAEIGRSARKLGRKVDDTLRDEFGLGAPTYVLAGAVAFLGLAVLWAGRERD